jgi:hypothetical protein
MMLPQYGLGDLRSPSGGWDRILLLYYNYLVVNSATDTVINEVTITDRYTNYKEFKEVSLSGGSYPRVIISNLEDLASRDEVRAGSYEPRDLQFGLVYNGAGVGRVIWLRSASGKADLIYSPSGNPTYGLQAKTHYTVDQFNAKVKLGLAAWDQTRKVRSPTAARSSRIK